MIFTIFFIFIDKIGGNLRRKQRGNNAKSEEDQHFDEEKPGEEKNDDEIEMDFSPLMMNNENEEVSSENA